MCQPGSDYDGYFDVHKIIAHEINDAATQNETDRCGRRIEMFYYLHLSFNASVARTMQSQGAKYHVHEMY